MKRALFPMSHAERAELLDACKADLPIVTPVWIATAGGAAMCTTPACNPFPQPRNHAEEIANARAEAAHR